MGTITLPYTITNGQTTDAVKLMADLNAILTEVNGNLEAVNIKNLAVIAAKLAIDAVETLKIKDANVTAVKLATDSVETLKIKDANVTAAKLAADAVETLKIKDANVTAAKLDFTVSAFIKTLLDDADAAAAVATLGVLGNPLTVDDDIIMRIGGVPARFPKRTKIWAYLQNNQSIPITTSTQLVLSSEQFDDTGEWDTGTYRFTVVNPGFYLIGAMITFASPEDAKYYQARIDTNYGSSALSEVHGSNTSNISVSVTLLMKLVATDVVQLNAYHNSAGAKNAVAGSNTTYMYIVQVF